MSEIDHELTENFTICPWCGYRDEDAWEYIGGQVYDCPERGEPYLVEYDITKIYTTYKEVNQ